MEERAFRGVYMQISSFLSIGNKFIHFEGKIGAELGKKYENSTLGMEIFTCNRIDWDDFIKFPAVLSGLGAGDKGKYGWMAPRLRIAEIASREGDKDTEALRETK